VGLKKDTNWSRPLLGMQEFPRQLQARYRDMGGISYLSQQLQEVKRVDDKDYPWTLTFVETTTSPCTGITTPTSKVWHLRAKQLVLAMPKAALGSISFAGTLPDQEKSLAIQIDRLLAAIQGVPFMKMHATYSQRWWQDTGIGAKTGFNVGRFTSSNPVSNVFAWYPGTQARDQDGNYSKIPGQCQETSGKNMGMIQLYATGHPAETWSGLMSNGRQQECSLKSAAKCSECFNSHSGFYVTETNPATNHISQTLVEGVRIELAEMFGVDPSQIPEPTEMKYKIWDAQDPVTKSDAVHFWKAGQEWWKLYDEVLEVGGKSSKLHIVGEAFSFNWGWGEGALETAEYMLHEHMNIPLPNWIAKKEYCLAMPFYPYQRK